MEVKDAYRLFKRQGMFYVQDNATGRQTSLRTKDETEAQRLLAAKNHAANDPQLNIALGKAYLTASDPECAKRTWTHVFGWLIGRGKETSRERWERAMRSKPFALLLGRVIIETKSNDFQTALGMGGNFTNHTLRQLQNTACGMGWLHSPIIPLKPWPKPIKTPKRGITAEEHAKIMAKEKNDERRRYDQFLWETGAAQSDAANVTAEAINWETRVLYFKRLKNSSDTHQMIGTELGQLLREQAACFVNCRSVTEPLSFERSDGSGSRGREKPSRLSRKEERRTRSRNLRAEGMFYSRAKPTRP